jgi:hypothetical protein
MSTPSGKPLNPIDHVSRKAREGAEGDNDPFRSAYAPRRAPERTAVRSDFADDAEPLPTVRAQEGLREAEPHLRSRDAPGGGHIPEKLGSNERNRGDHLSNRDEIMSDHDLARLEASLRWLQRQESATRLPRATNMAAVPGLAPIDAGGRRQSGERFGDGFWSPRSLEPERLRPPPEMPRGHIGAPAGIVVAIILGATIAYYFAVGGRVPPSEPAPAPQTASSDPTLVALPSSSISQQAPPPTMAQDDDRATSAQSEISSPRTKTSQPARSSEGEAVAMVQPGQPGAQVQAASKATRALDPEEIKLLMKQGEQFIAAGDVVTARIVFQRAAEAGDAGAAVALGGTYDPIVLAKLGVVGLGADVERARTWYQKAESFGSAEATWRLAILANR